MKLLLLCIASFYFISCHQKEKLKGGVCLSFDDRYINEWFELRDLFLNNEVKVTFFITQLNSLSTDEIQKLKLLQNDGHEIGFHGMHHVLSEHYIKEYSYKEYFEYEINPGIRWMDSLEFNCTSFAYPYGAKYWFTDYLLGEKFEVLRGVSSLKRSLNIVENDAVFYSHSGNKTVDAIGFDVISAIDTLMINEAIDRSVNTSEVLLLFAHRPSHYPDKGYSFNIEGLKYIIKKVKENDLSFYLINELGNKEVLKEQ